MLGSSNPEKLYDIFAELELPFDEPIAYRGFSSVPISEISEPLGLVIVSRHEVIQSVDYGLLRVYGEPFIGDGMTADSTYQRNFHLFPKTDNEAAVMKVSY